MFAAYSLPVVWVAIVLAGIVGCVATAFVANMRADVPVKAVAGNWKKHLWSIIFVIPVPFLLTLPLGLVWSFLWLMLAPTAASKAYFGPKDVPAMTLNTFHAGFAVAALVVYWVVVSVF